MLKFIFLLMMMIFLKNFWKIQNLYFCLTFFFFIFMLPNFWYGSSMNLFFFLDFLSFGLIILSFWLIGLMLMSSNKIFYFNNFSSFFLLLIFFLIFFLIFSFSVNNLMMFYFFFESSLIPTLILILGWGYQPERIQAGMYMLFYTLLVSLPLLLGILYLLFLNLNLFFYSLMLMSNSFNLLFYLVMIMAFLVKMPMFLTHLWLPKAHVEAPVSGSMILAGILLKLGGYGLMRIFFFLNFFYLNLKIILIIISLLGGIFLSLNCLRQIDIKSLIAYSSVVHMGLVLSSMFTYMNWGILNSYLMMIAHGLCSSGLFCISNIVYERLSSRSLMINKGLMNFMPSLTLWWFLLCSSNMSAPPSLNLLGEIGLLNSVVAWSWMSMFLLFFLSFFSACYCFFIFSFSQHGMFYSSIFSFSSGLIREFKVLFLHWIPLNIFLLKCSMLVLWI